MSSAEVTLVSLLGASDNFSEPKPAWNEKSTILGVVITFLVVSVLCILFRLYTRIFVVKSLGWDDFFVVLFMLSGATGSIFICLLTNYGLGEHFLTLNEETTVGYLVRFWVANATYAMSTTFIKLSLLFQYLRIYNQHSLLRTLTIVMAIVIGLWGLLFSFVSWFPCFPVSGYWNLAADATCYWFGSRHAGAFVNTYISHAAFNLVFDLAVLALPIPIYFNKGRPSQTRIGLVGLFLMGALINVFSVWRLASIVQHRAATWPTFDPSWYSPVSVIQACLEIDAASICASMPVFWPTVKTGFDKIFVTQEITITRSHRRLSEGDGDDDDVELQQSGSGHQGPVGMHSREGSETSLNGMETHSVQRKASHYQDTYVLDQVDPLRTEKRVGVESNVTVGLVGGGLRHA